VQKLAEGTFSTAELGRPALASSMEELAEVPKVPGTELAEAPKHAVRAKGKAAEEPGLGETTGLPKILSPPSEPELPKVWKAPAITPKKRRMTSVLDAVMESTRASTSALAKETTETATTRAEPEAGPSVPLNKDLQASVLLWRKKTRPRRLNLLLPKHLLKILTLLFDMLRVKGCMKGKLRKPNTTPGN
jgi:hypothetical protein